MGSGAETRTPCHACGRGAGVHGCLVVGCLAVLCSFPPASGGTRGRAIVAPAVLPLFDAAAQFEHRAVLVIHLLDCGQHRRPR